MDEVKLVSTEYIYRVGTEYIYRAYYLRLFILFLWSTLKQEASNGIVLGSMPH